MKVIALLKNAAASISCALAFAVASVGCDSLSGGKTASVPKGYEFAGARMLVPNDDGTYNLTWPVAPLKEATYRIFEKQEGQDFDWNKPASQTKETLWRTADLRLSPSRCYAVRFAATGFDNDVNTKALCTPKSTYAFGGLKGVTRTEEGAWLLDWDVAPFKSGVSYRVYGADPSGAIEQTALREVTENQTRVGPFPLGVVKCFVVRLMLGGKPGADTNTKTKCTDANQLKGFTGIESAESPATGVVRLTWTASQNDDVMGYLVYRGDTFSEVVAKVEPRQVGSATLKDLEPGTFVTFGVRALNARGIEDANKRTVSVTVKDQRPLKFAGLQAANVSGRGEALLRWTAHPAAASYRVYSWSGEAGGRPFVSFTAPLQTVQADLKEGTVEHRVRGLGDEMSHAFVVRAVSKFDVEDANETTLAVMLPDQGSPLFKGVKSAANVGGKIQINWDPPLGQVSRYKIYRAQGSVGAIDFSSTTLPTEPGNSNSAILSGFQANRAYTFVVRAEDQNGNLDSNTQAVTIVAGQQSLPEFAGYVSVLPGSEGQIKVTWLSSISASMKNYLVQWRRPGTVEWGTITETHAAVSTKMVTIMGLASKTRYEVRVRAVDLYGNESVNDEIRTVTTVDETPPDFGGVLSAAQAPGAATITVHWQERSTDDIDHFRIYWSETPLNTYMLGSLSYKKAMPTSPTRVFISPVVDGTSTSFEVTSLTKGKTYYFVAHAVDSSGNESGDAGQFVQVSTAVLNSFPSIAASLPGVRSPERESAETIVLTASDVNQGDALTIEQVSTTCPSGFNLPTMTVQAQSGRTRTARIDWTPSQNFIESNRPDRTCSATYRVGDGESFSPNQILTFSSYNREPRLLTVNITPQSGGFRRYRNLECTATALDDDGNGLTYQYQWHKNDLPLVGQTSATLTTAAGAFTPNDKMTCRASAFDDHARVEAASAIITFGNDAPVLAGVGVSEDGGLSPINVGDRIACNWNVNDADNDPVVLESLIVEGSDDGQSNWAPLGFNTDTCSIVQATRRCFTVSTAAKRKYLRCRVTSISDGFSVTPGASSQSNAQVANGTPSLTSVVITPAGTIARGNTLTCQVDSTDPDGDPLVTPPSIQWTRDNVAIPGATQATYSVDLADRGKALRCAATLLYNADGFGSPASASVISAQRTYTNSNPVITQVGVVPATNVMSGTMLTCSPVVSDPDDDTVQLGAPYSSFTWYSNSGTGNQEIAGQTNSTLVVTQDLRGKDVRCAYGLAANSDGRGADAVSQVLSVNKVTPGNSSPVISDVSVSATASPAVTGTVLTCNRTVTDPDGDALVDNPRYAWRANGTTIAGAASQTYVMRRGDRAKQVTCGVSLAANADGRLSTAVPEVASTNNVVSINSQPAAANVLVTSLQAAPYYPGTILSCGNYSLDDADFDPLFPSFKWYLNEAEIPGETAADYTARSADRAGQIRCAVFLAANADGFGSTEATTKSGNAYLVQNRDAVNTFTPLVDVVGGGQAYKTATLRCRAPSSVLVRDPDGDTVTDRFVWRKGGALFPGTDANGTTSPDLSLASDATLVPGGVITCSMRIDDGRSVVTTGESSSTVVANRSPVATSLPISVTPSTIYSPANGQVLTCNAPTFTDADGDTVTIRHNWRLRRPNTNNGNWMLMASNLAANTVTFAQGTAYDWRKGDELVCSVTVTDGTATLSSQDYPTTNGSGLTLTLSTANVVNNAPVGTFKCNGNNTTVVGYANASFGPTDDCITTNTITDGDSDAITYFASTDPTKTTCPDVGTKILIDPTDGRISGLIPTSACQLTIGAQDTSNVAVRTTAGGALAEATISIQLPFTAVMSDPSLDSACVVSVPTSFAAGNVGFGGSNFVFSALVGGPQTHTGANTASGVMTGTLNPAGGGGSATATWNVTGSAGGFFSPVTKAFTVVDSPASPDVSTTPLAMPGLQAPPKFDNTGNRAASCGLANCAGAQGVVASGYGHSCSVTSAGDLYCWGQNGTGELGQGNTTTPSPSLPVAVPLGGSDKSGVVVAGGTVLLDVAHTCAVIEDRSTNPFTNKGVKCWGNNAYGQLGTGTIPLVAPFNVTSPAQVQGLTGGTGTSAVRALVAGGAYTCALMNYTNGVTGGSVKCWGANDKGQLGTGTTQTEAAPAPVLTFETSGALAIAAGYRHTCAVTNVRTVKCWGENEHLQLGVQNSFGQGTIKTSPTEVPNLTNVVSITAGDRHTCALRDNGEVKCWGAQSEGRLGNSQLGGSTEIPQPLVGSIIPGFKATALSAGSAHTCAIVEGGGARCWGNNQQGQVGDNSSANNKSEPVQVLDLNSQAVAVEAGYAHTCFLKNTGGVSCFGFYNAIGLELGQRKPVNNAMPVSALGIPAAQFLNCRALRILKE